MLVPRENTARWELPVKGCGLPVSCVVPFSFLKLESGIPGRNCGGLYERESYFSHKFSVFIDDSGMRLRKAQTHSSVTPWGPGDANPL